MLSSFHGPVFFSYSLGSVKLDKTNSVESLPELLTSDSEGSYAGVGSPRDLQSPDFTKGFHPERTEVGFLSSWQFICYLSNPSKAEFVFWSVPEKLLS